MRVWLFLALLGLASPVVARAGDPPPGSRPPQPVTIGHVGSAGSVMTRAAETFAADLSRRLPGRFQIAVKGATSLGDETDIWAAVRLGAIDLAMVTTTGLAAAVPRLGVLDVPYLFHDPDQSDRVLDGAVGRILAADIRREGGQVLGFIEFGYRHLMNSRRPVRTPGEMAGLRIRVIPQSMMELAFRQWGAAPVPLSWSSTYAALRDQHIDGLENTLSALHAGHFDQSRRFISLTGHVFAHSVLIINPDTYAGFSTEERAAVAAAVAAAAAGARAQVREEEPALLVALRAEGIEVDDPIDLGSFIAALAPLETEWTRRFGADLLDQIRSQP